MKDNVTHLPGQDEETEDREERKKFHLPETERDISKQLCPHCAGRIDDAMTATMIDIRNRLNVLEALGELIDDDYDPDVPTGTEIRDRREFANRLAGYFEEHEYQRVLAAGKRAALREKRKS